MGGFSPIKDLMYVLLAPHCCACGRQLIAGEHDICYDCLKKVRPTGQAEVEGNDLELRLKQLIACESAASYMFFRKGDVSQHIVHDIKYYGNERFGRSMGRVIGRELRESGRFEGVDVVVPVPLHFVKFLQRGYNQSFILGKGVAEELGKKVETGVLYRKYYTMAQARKGHGERHKNIEGSFGARHGERLKGKHVLLFDDVITTGATVVACAEALKGIEGVKVSVASLAYAGG